MKVVNFTNNWLLEDVGQLIKAFSFIPSLDNQPFLRCNHLNDPLQDASPKGVINGNGNNCLLRNTILHCSTPFLPHPCILLPAPLETTHKEAFALNSAFSHVWMWELDHKESWALKNWCLWTVVLEKTLESPLDCKKIQPDLWRRSALGFLWKEWC